MVTRRETFRGWRLPCWRPPQPQPGCDLPRCRGRTSSSCKRQLFQYLALVSIFSLCVAPGAEAFFIKKKIKLLKASKGKFGVLGHRPYQQQQPVAAVAWPQPHWAPPSPPPPQPVPASPAVVATPWNAPPDYSSAWVQQAQGWQPPVPHQQAWHPPPQQVWHSQPPQQAWQPPPQLSQQPPSTTFVAAVHTPSHGAVAQQFALAAKHRHRPSQEYEFAVQCPYELYVTDQQDNKDRW
ncbi:uncharacterized protein LOC144175809 [Haemaphysalis longicornis]